MDLTVNEFDKICRACLRRSHNMKSLFTKLENNDKVLKDSFSCILNISIETDDVLPKQICEECESIIYKAEMLKQRCQESENILRKMTLVMIETSNLNTTSPKEHENKNFLDSLNSIELQEDNKNKLNEFSQSYSEEKNDYHEVPIKEEIELEDCCMDSFDAPEALETYTDEEKFTFKYECKCGEVFHDIDPYTKHNCKKRKKQTNNFNTNKLLSDIEEFNCAHCPKKLKNLAALKSHIKTHIQKVTQLVECDLCMRKFKNKATLKKHIKRHQVKDKVRFTCERCKRDFKYQAFLDSHMISVHGINEFRCDVCNQVLDTLQELEIHKDNHKSKKHICKVCSKAFFMLCSLKDHIRSHTGEKPFLCSTCGKGFSQKNNMLQHTKRHLGLKAFKCDICPKSFVSKGELEAHHRKHSGAHPFICDECGSGFTTSSSLVKHRRIHTGEKPFQCDLCPMKFTASGTLKNHRRTHTGERPFQCSYCDKAFIQRNDLISHIRCHTGERPYVCTQCGLTFRKTAALKAHVKMHGKEALVMF